MKEPNSLINASSPYLLQHAYNPVEWHEWNSETLAKAKRENKLIIVSIGYSACHWCHVMEHESFENFEVAEVMNKHFVCVKVDREERPDIDQIYMLAVQLMNGNGGWPLNAICLPDQRPIYGGTYFRKNDWINILLNVADLWKNEPEKARDYATKLTQGIHQSESIKINNNKTDFSKEHLVEIITPWKRNLDMADGGYNRAPKFPLPNNWTFMLRYSYLMNDEAAAIATMLTLEKMALGGIYDQVGGGFARYSVDGIWHVPHFEKMLYDNAQLISLYTEAYQYLKIPLYKEVVEETIKWIEDEMTAKEGLFFSALDADSEGVEGKFYIWDFDEFNKIVGEDSSLLASYYNVTEAGNWEEEESNVLQRKLTDDEFAKANDLDVNLLADKVHLAKQRLLKARASRVRPGLDDKCLVAWNGLMIKALAEASLVFDNQSYYLSAKRAAAFILDHLKTDNGGLYRNYKDGKASIPAFLDDYALFVESLIALYEVDFDESWLDEAKGLSQYVLDYFSDPNSAMFFYTSSQSEALIARKHEIMDNVIPASNSVMSQNLRKLGLLYDDEILTSKATEMLNAVLPSIKSYGSAYSNWSIQLLNEVFGLNEVAIVGDDIETQKKELHKLYVPNKITLGGTKSKLPLLKNRQSHQTKIYICRNKTCQLPVSTVAEAVKFIN
ncbi:MAG: thioredoxin domain-containing protein [Pedobacter sp.]|nr:MAG: thioredoxin domain-containing protein [Pedobacter sp.]